ncbi:MAG: NAD(P)/FAD-dependent oxidoreductase, partial [Bacteroidota bacterium]
IVGAGLSGLACARALQDFGIPFTILEQSDAPGGRVRTDVVDGFRLDRGFQVLLTAYPTAQQVFNYDELNLQRFDPGAKIYLDGKASTVGDPRRNPTRALSSLVSPIGGFGDKLNVLKLRQQLVGKSVEDAFASPNLPTHEALREVWDFSDRMASRFFRPFFGGITFDPDLGTSNRFFEFVMKMFSEGDAAVPALGMGELSRQVAEPIPDEAFRFGVTVKEAGPGRLVLSNGQQRYPKMVVVATEAPAAAAMTGAFTPTRSLSNLTLYFSAEKPPFSQPLLALNGDTAGVVNNLAVMSNVAPSYAPAGASLIAASIVAPRGSTAELEEAARAQLTKWFGPNVRKWTRIGAYWIDHALPAQPPSTLSEASRPTKFADNLYICGDHRENASIEGALVSGIKTGRLVAEAFLERYRN